LRRHCDDGGREEEEKRRSRERNEERRKEGSREMIKDQGKWGRTVVCDDELGIEAQPRLESS
jgi:hypothetical protein